MEWDESKRLSNLEKHGLDFRDAERVLARPALVVPDQRLDYGEPRFRAVGRLDDAVVCLAFTLRGEGLRIISMRRASKAERRAYEARQE
jgi:uncharacterized protein